MVEKKEEKIARCFDSMSLITNLFDEEMYKSHTRSELTQIKVVSLINEVCT